MLINNHELRTGSGRGVDLHFLRRLRILRRGGVESTGMGGTSSKARAAARVAKLWRSKVNMSSSAQNEKK